MSEPKDIVRHLLMEHLVPPKIAKQALAGHFGVQATSINITEELLQKYGEACFKAGQEHDRA